MLLQGNWTKELFWMLHRCHHAASLSDKWFVYHLSSCCSVIIKCSFAHSRRQAEGHNERNSLPSSSSAKTSSVLFLYRITFNSWHKSGVKIRIITEKCFPSGGSKASNVLPLDELWESCIHWLGPRCTCG